jgi:2-dehydro-3-deoxyphosphogalactonate aldolase
MAVTLDQALAACPLVAILRGLTPEEAESIGRALVGAGFRVIEVPLNSPRALESIRRLAEAFGRDALIGAGTVLSEAEVEAVAQAGGRLVVSPHLDPVVVGTAVARGLVPMPGVVTPSEIFAARALGATAVKLFPAEMIPPQAVKALRAVVPRDQKLLPVGGLTPERIPAYRDAGADGFGLGSALYRPGSVAQEVAASARAFVAAAA